MSEGLVDATEHWTPKGEVRLFLFEKATRDASRGTIEPTQTVLLVGVPTRDEG
jgi:hypothetical protein